MQQIKKSVTARIPIELYDDCNQQYENMTDAIIAGLKLLCNQNEIMCKTDVITINEHKKCIEEKDAKIKELQNYNENLLKNLENLKNKEPDNKGILQLHEARIKDLQEQIKIKDDLQNARIKDLLDQLAVKDQQLEKKDTQIENITNTMQSQAINIHDMLNQKSIEATGNKKRPWYKFW
jgi:hypothetical protein